MAPDADHPGIARPSQLRHNLVVALVATLPPIAAFASVKLDLATLLADWLRADMAANVLVGEVFGVAIAAGLGALLWQRANIAHNRELTSLAQRDPLTGLPNRSALPDALQRAIRSTRDGIHIAAVLFVDLDRFKQVNDSYGHEVGDELMIAVAERLRANIGTRDIVVRHGGDEFIVLAGGLSTPAEAQLLAARLLKAMEAPFELGADTVRISASVGVAVSDRNGAGTQDLVYDADVAMYAAKADGRGTVRLFEPAMRARLSRANAAQRLRDAIDGHELGLRYAPIHTVGDGSLVAVRAQLVWEGEGRTPILGQELSSALEETGLVVPAGNQALGSVCHQVAAWAACGVTGVQVVVPASPRQLGQSTFRDHMAEVVAEHAIDPSALCVVVSDRSTANDITGAWAMMRHIRALGVPVALEGFGAGASSLADLRVARVDQLWIHGDLIAGLSQGPDDVAIVEHVIALAHQLGMIVIADCVETAAQHTMLRNMGCDRATGALFGGDLTAGAVAALARPARPNPLEERLPDIPAVTTPRLRIVR